MSELNRTVPTEDAAFVVLVEALERYGEHEPFCEVSMFGRDFGTCHCAYGDALAPEAVQQAITRYREALQPMFQLGDFTLHSGQESEWKIECDAAKDGDWETWAALISEMAGNFREVVGVPRGGIRLATVLEKYKVPGDFPVLVVDDVLTTGESILRTLDNLEGAVGWVVFARGDCPPGVQALFQMPTERSREALAVVERARVMLGKVRAGNPTNEKGWLYNIHATIVLRHVLGKWDILGPEAEAVTYLPDLGQPVIPDMEVR